MPEVQLLLEASARSPGWEVALLHAPEGSLLAQGWLHGLALFRHCWQLALQLQPEVRAMAQRSQLRLFLFLFRLCQTPAWQLVFPAQALWQS